MTKPINIGSEKEIRTAQLEELKKGVFPGIYVIERRNSSFITVEQWEFESEEKSEAKYQELLDSGIPSVFLNYYVKFTFDHQ